MTEYSLEDSLNGIIEDILDHHMTVSDGACGSAKIVTYSPLFTTTIVAIVVTLLVVFLLCIVGFCIWKRKKQNDAKLTKEAMSAVTMSTSTVIAAEEVEVEVTAVTKSSTFEVEVNM